MLSIKSIEFRELKIPFHTAFQHASATRGETQSVIVKVTSHCGLTGFGEGCPREYVTDESIESALDYIGKVKKELLNESISLKYIQDLLNKNRAKIDENPSAWCAIELALLDLLAKHKKCTVEKILGVDEYKKKFIYTAVLGGGDIPIFKEHIKHYLKLGFEDYKVKITGDINKDLEKVHLLKNMLEEKSVENYRIRLDANNLWSGRDEAINHINDYDIEILGIEEPVSAGQYKTMAEISTCTDIPVILDESFLEVSQFKTLIKHTGNWIINIRVSKMGGLLRALEVINKAKLLQIPIIIGAHVGETSLLTRAGMVLARAAEDMLIAQEGAFGTHLLQRDICDRSVMFRDSCIVKVPEDQSGFGVL